MYFILYTLYLPAGLLTALFILYTLYFVLYTKVTPAVASAHGAAAVGYLYWIAGMAAAVLTLALLVLQQGVGGRDLYVLLGAAAFGLAAVPLAVCDAAAVAALPFGAWACLFVLYGAGLCIYMCIIFVSSSPHTHTKTRSPRHSMYKV